MFIARARSNPRALPVLHTNMSSTASDARDLDCVCSFFYLVPSIPCSVSASNHVVNIKCTKWILCWSCCGRAYAAAATIIRLRHVWKAVMLAVRIFIAHRRCDWIDKSRLKMSVYSYTFIRFLSQQPLLIALLIYEGLSTDLASLPLCRRSSLIWIRHGSRKQCIQ